jgi:murein DD-endopeptidase MepM/ murein hydrolase activator NlpD
MVFLVALLGVVTAGYAHAEDALSLRFCPAEHVRAYPLDDTGRLQSLQIPGIVLVNRGDAQFRVEQIEISLVDHGRVIDTRRLGEPEITRWVSNGPPLQDVIRSTEFEFCGQALVPPDVILAGPTLTRNEGLLVVDQVFAYDHVRDAVVVTVRGEIAGRAVDVSASVPILTGFAKTRLRFPLEGVWYVGWGPSFHTGHRAHVPEQFALDIARLGSNGSTHRGDGTRFRDYYAYGAIVHAAADGRVVETENTQPEDAAALQKPSENADAFVGRHLASEVAALSSRGPNWAAGNFVLIDHGDGEYSLYAHLRPGSLRVRPGDLVKAGQPIGSLGSSGNSTEPHLHFQVCDRPDPLLCAGIPVDFSNLAILWADLPRALQSGDIVTTR